MSEIIEGISSTIDDIMTLDVPSRGVIKGMYNEAARLYGRPQVLRTALKLKEIVAKDDPIFIITGFTTMGCKIGETDGPPGAVILARALKLGLKAAPLIITDSFNVDMLRSTCFGAGLNLVDFGKVSQVPSSASVGGFPMGDEEAKRAAEKYIEEWSPKAVISVERPGLNEKGVYHNMRGFDITGLNAKMDYLIEDARARGILTVGIADGGNEIGIGSIHDYVKEHIPRGSKCNCPCGGGVASATKTDILVTATVSNWGAYGISACLSAMLGDPNVFHNKDIEIRTIRQCADAGAYDLRFGTNPSVDNLPDHIHASIVELMRSAVESRLSVHYEETSMKDLGYKDKKA